MLGPEDKVIELKEFNGIWARGNPDECPQDHLIDCLNMACVAKGKILTRGGLAENQALGSPNGHIVEMFQSSIMPLPQSTASTDLVRWVTFDENGHFYLDSSATPIKTVSGASDFTGLNMFNRTFISPNFGRGGTKLNRLQIFYNYGGSDLIRDAAGPAPRSTTANFAAANSTNAGNVPVGVHKFAVIYETDTGFQSSPGPKIKVSNSTNTIAFSNGNPCIISFAVAIQWIPTASSGFQVSIEISGATGTNWGNINDFWLATVLNPFQISIPLDTTSFGAFTGTPVIYGPFTPASVTADGTHAVTLTNIPVGPSYVKKRIIIATQAGGSEYFFVPSGVIYDNSTTSLDVNFYDTDLVISADDWFDLMEVVPGGTGLCKYNGRLILVGAFFYDQTALVSNVGDPESFSLVTGFTSVPIENDGNSLVACGILRDTLYLFRFTGFWSVQDNGDVPSNWPVNVIDLTVGTYQKGLSAFTTTQSGASDTGDILLLASRDGLIIFDGVVRRPELTMKIQDIWTTIPLANSFGGFNNVQVTQSVWTHQIFIAYPSAANSVYADALLVGDYDPIPGLLDPVGIRWSKYSFPVTPTCIKTGDNLYVGSVQTNPGFIFKLDPTTASDYGSTAINNYLITYLANVVPGWIHFFKAFRLRVNATGTIVINLYGEDNVLTASLPITGNVVNTLAGMTQPAGKEFLQLINFVNEKMSIKVSMNAAGSKMNINRMEIFCIPRWQVRPG